MGNTDTHVQALSKKECRQRRERIINLDLQGLHLLNIVKIIVFHVGAG